MGDILKEAIADAKAVRETALQNAKMALEEAFTPQLKSMLSAKLKEDEYEDDDDLEQGGEEEGEEDVPAEEGSYHEDDEVSDEEDPFASEEEPDMEEEGVIEINGVKYAPVVSEEDEEEFGGEEEEEEGDLDLESVIKELESELSEGDDDESVEESKDDEAVEESKDDETVEESKDEIEEEFEIDENIFSEDKDEEEVEESNTSELESELKEYKEAVVFLKDKLHEVNILNAKLLFTNKLFREYSLDNSQKLKVVENFDRAQTTREIKLVYSTLAEQLNENSKITKKTKHITESASSAVGSTKPSKESRKVITEEQQVANRFKKLAGLIK